MDNNTPLWSPGEQSVASSKLTQFQDFVNQTHGLSLRSYPELHQYSINQKGSFWQAIAHFFNLPITAKEVLSQEHDLLNPEWFKGCQFNFAEQLLRHQGNQPAIIATDERGREQRLSFDELNLAVRRLAHAMKTKGIKPGMRVAGFLPNIKETVIAMLATTGLGAVWSSCSPDFGSQGVIDRLSQIEPQLLFTVDGYTYNGKSLPITDKLQAIQKAVPSIQHTVLIPFLEDKPSTLLPDTILYQAFVSNEQHNDFYAGEFNHPVYILFSSGTTGKPKCIVHGAGGTLLQHVKELGLHSNMGEGDRLMYFTTCGWMMWNWMASALALGTTLVLYEGAPTYPSNQRLFDEIDKHQVTHFGTSAKYLASMEHLGVTPISSHQLAKLNVIFSTGSPLSPGSFDYVYRDIKKDCQLSSISGGTDIISCFALGNPNLPVYRGELQCFGLGMEGNVYNDEGKPVIEEKGELVCQSVFPSMPVGFYNDPNKEKYHNAYFTQFTNTWAQGDYAKITRHGGVVIYGRSDTVLNPGGVRIGTAEIYRQVETITAIRDSVVIGQPIDDDEQVVLFVVLEDDQPLNDALINNIKQTIRANASPRHVPKQVIEVSDIPKTVSGKTAELAVKQTVLGLPVKNKDALLNPESLVQFATALS